MALAGIGDAVLYPLLPVYYSEFQIPLAWVGLMLSANRIVRLLANTAVARAISRWGMKPIVLLGGILATLTTSLYGLGLGLWIFFVARIVWGLSYASLKISTLNYASEVVKNRGFVFGLVESLKSTGAIFALWFGPTIVLAFGIQQGLLLLAGITCLSIPLALGLPNKAPQSVSPVSLLATFQPNSMSLLVGLLALITDGVLVVCLADLLEPMFSRSEYLLAAVAGYLLLKRISMSVVSFINGLMSLRLAPLVLFKSAVIASFFSLVLIGIGYEIIGVVTIFIFNAIIVSFSPLVAISADKDQKRSLQTISSVTTWWDLGAGLGALIGIPLIHVLGQKGLFMGFALLIGVTFISFLNRHGK